MMKHFMVGEGLSYNPYEKIVLVLYFGFFFGQYRKNEEVEGRWAFIEK